VRNILVNHGAQVSVHSAVGQGTTFCMEIDAS
jgi:signal transduction histidine kinase